jgi:two-component system sensor histidine kinase/response regulator
MNDEVTILIVDDKTENIFALEKLLERSNRIFLRATSGKEGLKIALERDLDLIILDVQMPEMDGFEVAKVLKSHKRTRDIPIIFASAEKKERQSIMKGFEEGAVDYLPKPLDPEVTRAKVTVLLKIQLQKREINQLYSELKMNVEQLKTVNKELESFSYSVSHDLRTPLRILNGYSSILLEDYADKLDDEGKRMLKGIQKNAKRMNKLVEDLLEFSKLGRKEPKKSRIDTETLVADIVNEIGISRSNKATIKLNPLIPVWADLSLITQVWTNLISNAIKYSSGKDHPSIEIGSIQDNEIVYYVKDNGAGFSMEYVDKLFGVFQRLHKADEFEGTGVGLAIVHKIIEKHGGRVWAEGRVNEGATFYFSLPNGPAN